MSGGQVGGSGARPESSGRLRVLVVEDEAEMRHLLRHTLEREGFAVDTAADGEAALAGATSGRPDLVLLDLTLPGMDGLRVLERVRRDTAIPVIVLSGRQALIDRVGGLHLGADDYVVKPFHVSELIARIRTVLRRATPERHDVIELGALRVDTSSRLASIAGTPLDLTRKEFELLSFLARNADRAFGKSRLLHEVWQSTSEWQDDATVSEHVRRVRKKLEAAGGPACIETIRGVGYRLSSKALGEG